MGHTPKIVWSIEALMILEANPSKKLKEPSVRREPCMRTLVLQIKKKGYMMIDRGI